ncbi:hypothetical protein PVAG01_03293 [Phlyctema vagabunda]|uniref:Uncharacterized protein n=1 Tax=Phlyctema vagabunda TaxID=108571 RepID=A0ABR4PLA0_9HELO
MQNHNLEHSSVTPQNQAQPGRVRQRICNCQNELENILSRIPTRGSVPFDNILKLTRDVIEQWTTTNNCRSCWMDQQGTNLLVKISEQMILLYEAASTLYAVNDDVISRGFSSASNPQPQIICQKSPTFLGQITLDDEETTLLAQQLLHVCLVRVGSLIHELQEDYMQVNSDLRQDEGGMGARMSRNKSKLLALLGRIKSTQK